MSGDDENVLKNDLYRQSLYRLNLRKMGSCRPYLINNRAFV